MKKPDAVYFQGLKKSKKESKRGSKKDEKNILDVKEKVGLDLRKVICKLLQLKLNGKKVN